MTDSPFLDPNDPHYSDTPSVDEHPLEGGRRALARVLHEKVTLPGHAYPGRPWNDACDETADLLLDYIRTHGYLLVSEAELAEALRTALPPNAYRGSWHSNHQTMQPMGWDEDDAVARIAEDAFAALAKQQEARER